MFLFSYITLFSNRRHPKFWHMWIASTSTCTLNVSPDIERIGSAVLNYFRCPYVNAACHLCLDNARVYERTALWEIDPVVDYLSKKGRCFEFCNIFVFKIKALFSIVDRIGSAVLTHHWCVCVQCACDPEQEMVLQHFCFQDKSIILNCGQDRLCRPHSSLMCICTLSVLPRTKKPFVYQYTTLLEIDLNPESLFK